MPPHAQFDPNYAIPPTKAQSVRVSDLMTKRVIQAIGPDATVAEAVKKMEEVRKGCLLVLEGARPVGILTEWDLVHKVLAQNLPPDRLEVSRVMTKELITIGPEESVSEAAKVMTKNGIRRLVVMVGGQVVGVLTTTDFAKLLAR
ncbi:MAG: CBS domain-containing protein [Nitrososphaerales archaeon]